MASLDTVGTCLGPRCGFKRARGGGLNGLHVHAVVRDFHVRAHVKVHLQVELGADFKPECGLRGRGELSVGRLQRRQQLERLVRSLWLRN